MQLFNSCDYKPKENVIELHFGFLGAGKMAQAIVKGLLISGIDGCQITLTDRSGESFADSNKYNVNYIQTNIPMIEKSDIIFICVKPNQVWKVLTEVGSRFSNKLIVSVVAGLKIEDLELNVPASNRVIRMMPNIACLVQQGAGVFSRGRRCTDEDVSALRSLMHKIFPVFEEIPEQLMNAASALSGSAPAYILMVIEAMADGGTRLGLSRELSYRLAVQTVLGTAQLTKDTGTHPAILREQVCSAGGSTLAGTSWLEKTALRAAFADAIEAAKKRNDELASN